jgi:hypothetical protein
MINASLLSHVWPSAMMLMMDQEQKKAEAFWLKSISQKS